MPANPSTTLQGVIRWAHGNVLWKPAGRVVLALLPLFLYFWISQDPIALSANLILVSLYIGAARVGYGLRGLVLHAAVILLVFGMLLFAQRTPALFAILATLMATGAVWISRFREGWRTFGNFFLIPSVYLAMDLFERTHGQHLWGTLGDVVRCTAIGFVFLVLLCRAWWKMDGRTDSFFSSFGPPEPPNPQWKILTVSVFVAEIIATASIVFLDPPNAQWVVWSVVSVITGDSLSGRQKLRDRIVGGLVGVGLGMAVSLVVPHLAAGVSVLTVVSALTLVSFRHYPFAFGCRCFFVTLAAALGDSAHHSQIIGLERVGNVVLGGLLGFVVLLLVESLARHGRVKWLRAKSPLAQSHSA